MDGAGRRVWVANPDSNTVTVLNADTMAVAREIPVGKHPMSVALDAAGRAWVACRDSDEVLVLDPGSGQQIE